jgi:hypothetical protein
LVLATEATRPIDDEMDGPLIIFDADDDESFVLPKCK